MEGAGVARAETFKVSTSGQMSLPAAVRHRCGTPSNDKQSWPVSSIFPTSSRSSPCGNWPGGWV
jgi:hypothetical protein